MIDDISKLLDLLSYYLNHVGYKGLSDYKSPFFYRMYYLNHVGYKDWKDGDW